MLRHLAILTIFIGLSMSSGDIQHICKNARLGEALSNPMDCSSYFICEKTTPTLNYCSDGLHFDAERKVCNWPGEAKCKVRTTVERQTSKLIVEPNARPYSLLIAIDTETGMETDPMAKYDPEYVECRHYGAYFLPHPQNCRKYFMCAFGHLLQHHCGQGTQWNHKRRECELSAEAECYSTLAVEEDLNDTEHLTAAATQPIPENSHTVCYLYLEDGSTVPIAMGTPGSIWYPTGSYQTATASETETPPIITTIAPTVSTTLASSTPRADVTVPIECPKDRQAYLAHPQDCSKYYICIVGMPVLTSCPVGLNWDRNAEFCDLAKNVQCNQS